MVSCNSALRSGEHLLVGRDDQIVVWDRCVHRLERPARLLGDGPGKGLDALVGAILIAPLRPPALLLLARVAGRLELNAAIPGLPFHQPEEGVPLIGGEDGVGRIVIRGADELAQRRDGPDSEPRVDRDVERNRLEYPLMMAGDDDDPSGLGIELLIEVGRESLHIGCQALECRTARTVAIDRLVEIAPQLLPRRATRGAILLTRRPPLGSLWLWCLETAWR